MEKQMDVTEALTKKLNSKGLKSYLDTNDMVLDKLQQERKDLKEFLVSFYVIVFIIFHNYVLNSHKSLVANTWFNCIIKV